MVEDLVNSGHSVAKRGVKVEEGDAQAVYLLPGGRGGWRQHTVFPADPAMNYLRPVTGWRLLAESVSFPRSARVGSPGSGRCGCAVTGYYKVVGIGLSGHCWAEPLCYNVDAWTTLKA